MTISGVIANAARGELPRTWDALLRYTGYGEDQLQFRVNWQKWTSFLTVCDASIEASVYDYPSIMVTAKRTALSVIPGAIDFWGSQLLSETTTGTNETVSYPDRRDGLYRIQQRLLAELPALEDQLVMQFGRNAIRRVSVPQVSDVSDFRTLSPSLFPVLMTTIWPGIAPWYETTLIQ